MPNVDLVPAVHAFVTVALCGLIWFVQVVHYPLMARVGSAGFATYEAAHVRRTTWVVAPLMLTEAASAAALVLAPPDGADRGLVLTGAVLLLLVWAATAWLSVPCHRRLAGGWDAAVARRLVRTNWVRTAAWSARAAIAVALLATAPG